MANQNTQVAFRLPDKLLARLDKHVQRLNRESPGLDLKRSDAVRMILTRALDGAEREPRKPA